MSNARVASEQLLASAGKKVNSDRILKRLLLTSKVDRCLEESLRFTRQLCGTNLYYAHWGLGVTVKRRKNVLILFEFHRGSVYL